MLRFSAISACLRFYGSLLVIAVIFLALDAGSWVLRSIMRDSAHRRRLGRAWLHTIARLAIRYLQAAGMVDCDLSALKSLRTVSNIVLVANHPSRLDSLILASALPHMTCVTKASIWERSTLGSTLRTAGYPRHDTLLRLIGPASQSLEESGQLLLFPEGTRSRAGAEAGAFQPGFAAIAQRLNADVQPLLIETNSPYLSQGWPFLRMPPLPMRYRVKAGARLPAPTRDQASARALIETVEQILKQASV
ncbi:lysophospholipid acyltransferase family protein [Acetobacter indonesiensis]|uniref:Glycerol acyltransferase n=1 Tax=Acetobacter indonesiensis TaxID=104101 RepID=A0A252AUX5_9PROT|nr:lysophospholipid acyltransferase family protein [Acetobacter indonesiensis]OUI94042.1 glycerol acyltransferase [Acetobacter indonesiensis]